jgi:hypothetical protein
MASRGNRPEIVRDDVSCGSLMSLVGAGFGITWLTEASAGAIIAGLVYREVRMVPSRRASAIPRTGARTISIQPRRAF